MIKSPFFGPEDEMLGEIHEVLRKYGYQEVMLVYTEAASNTQSLFHCSSTIVSEGLIEYLGYVAEDMQDLLHEETDWVLRYDKDVAARRGEGGVDDAEAFE